MNNQAIDYALLNYIGGTGYGSPSTMGQFLSDYNNFNNVKRWINKYSRTKEVNVRLMINQMVILFNMFTFESVEYILKEMLPTQLIYIDTLFAFFLGRKTYGNGIDQEMMQVLKGILK